MRVDIKLGESGSILPCTALDWCSLHEGNLYTKRCMVRIYALTRPGKHHLTATSESTGFLAHNAVCTGLSQWSTTSEHVLPRLKRGMYRAIPSVHYLVQECSRAVEKMPQLYGAPVSHVIIAATTTSGVGVEGGHLQMAMRVHTSAVAAHPSGADVSN